MALSTIDLKMIIEHAKPNGNSSRYYLNFKDLSRAQSFLEWLKINHGPKLPGIENSRIITAAPDIVAKNPNIQAAPHSFYLTAEQFNALKKAAVSPRPIPAALASAALAPPAASTPPSPVAAALVSVLPVPTVAAVVTAPIAPPAASTPPSPVAAALVSVLPVSTVAAVATAPIAPPAASTPPSPVAAALVSVLPVSTVAAVATAPIAPPAASTPPSPVAAALVSVLPVSTVAAVATAPIAPPAASTPPSPVAAALGSVLPVSTVAAVAAAPIALTPPPSSSALLASPTSGAGLGSHAEILAQKERRKVLLNEEAEKIRSLLKTSKPDEFDGIALNLEKYTEDEQKYILALPLLHDCDVKEEVSSIGYGLLQKANLNLIHPLINKIPSSEVAKFLSGYVYKLKPATEKFRSRISYVAREYTKETVLSLFSKAIEWDYKETDCHFSDNLTFAGDLWTGLHSLFWSQPACVNLLFLNNVPVKNLEAAAPLLDNNGETALHTVLKFQNSAVASLFIDKISPETLEACCKNDLNNGKENVSILAFAFSYHAPALIAKLLEKLTEKAFKTLLDKDSTKGKGFVNLCANYLVNAPTWQTEIIDLLFNKRIYAR